MPIDYLLAGSLDNHGGLRTIYKTRQLDRVRVGLGQRHAQR